MKLFRTHYRENAKLTNKQIKINYKSDKFIFRFINDNIYKLTKDFFSEHFYSETSAQYNMFGEWQEAITDWIQIFGCFLILDPMPSR